MGQDYKIFEKLIPNKSRFAVKFAQQIIIEIEKQGIREDELNIEIELGVIAGPEDIYDDYTIDLYKRFLNYLEEQGFIEKIEIKSSTLEYDSELEDIWTVSFVVKSGKTLKDFLSKFIFTKGYFNGHKIQYRSGVLSIDGQNVEIRKGKMTDSDKLLKTLSKDFSREWTTEEILEDWDIDILDDTVPRQKILQAAIKINKKVAKAFGIEKFLVGGTECVRLNRNL